MCRGCPFALSLSISISTRGAVVVHHRHELNRSRRVSLHTQHNSRVAPPDLSLAFSLCFRFHRVTSSSFSSRPLSISMDSNSHLHQQQQQYNNDVHDPFQQQQHHHQQQQQQQQTGGKPAGTITGMLADFSRALGTHSKECFLFSTSPFSFVYNETALLLWCA